MTKTIRIATVHADVGLPIQLALLDAIDEVLREFGIDHPRIDPASRTDLVVLTEVDAESDSA